ALPPPPEPVIAAPAPPPPPPPAPAARPSPTFSVGAPMPSRIVRPPAEEREEEPIPDAGDVVEHFAFGRCEVVKSDGDRLHLRLPKDQRIKEIALEMLKVSMLPPEEGQTSKHWKLARRI
ncbi:MAG: Proline-rich protein, partial [Labilithrix sp.]|nr:Proline-rich protein [Labilithrix sp.]